MIVAAYLETYLETTLFTPVRPVTRIERLNRQGRDSHQPGHQKNAFAFLLATAMKTDDDESNGFDAKA